MSDEKKEVERKKQAVEKLKEIATGKGLNPEEDAQIKRATIEIRKEEFRNGADVFREYEGYKRNLYIFKWRIFL